MWPAVNNSPSKGVQALCHLQENEKLPMMGEKMVKYTTDMTMES